MNKEVIVKDNQVVVILEDSKGIKNESLKRYLQLYSMQNEVTLKPPVIKKILSIKYHRNANENDYLLIVYEKRGAKYDCTFEITEKMKSTDPLKKIVFDYVMDYYIRPAIRCAEERLYKGV